jgi:5'(3')-deoxyribonucleotidase
VTHEPAAPVIAVDLDDTCADRLAVIAARLRAQGLAVDSRQPARWDLSDWGVRSHDHYDQLHHDAFARGAGYEEMQPLPGAAAGIRQLRAQGWRIRILTGRMWNAEVILPALTGTARWLARHQIPADDIAFVTDKAAVHADVSIEDAPHFIASLQETRRNVIIMDAAYNRHLAGPRAASWAQVPALAASLLRQLPGRAGPAHAE